MKNSNQLVIAAIFLLFIISCKKEKKATTITGIIVTDCSGTPMANKSLELYAQGNRFFGTGGGFYSFTTDSKGSFSVQNEDPIVGEELHIQYPNGGASLIQLTGSGDINIGTLNINPTANYQLKIKVNNPYSAGDTLIVHKYKLNFPFKDTIFPVVSNYSNPLNIPYLSDKNKVLFNSSYNVYSGKRGESSFVNKKYEYIDVFLNGCDNSIQEIVVAIN